MSLPEFSTQSYLFSTAALSTSLFPEHDRYRLFATLVYPRLVKIRDAAGQPYVLIGGQAVNYSERYLTVEPQLRSFQPFTSEDIDFKGGSDDVQHLESLNRRGQIDD